MSSIDVAVPCYQYGNYLETCVSSILAQEINDLRILIIDNASNDNSREVAQELAANDSRIELILRSVNRSATHSYNDAIDWAQSDYFLILDADDLLFEGSLKRAMTHMDRNSNVVFSCGVEAHLQPDGRITNCEDATSPSRWITQSGANFVAGICRTPINWVGANTVVRRTDVQKAAGYYRHQLPYSDDLELWLRLALLGDISYTNAVQAIRRIHPLQMSEYYRSDMLNDFIERERAFESFFHTAGGSIKSKDRLSAMARRNLGHHAYWSALSHLVRGRLHAAIGLIRFSVSRAPWVLVYPPITWICGMKNPLGRVRQIAKDAFDRFLVFSRP